MYVHAFGASFELEFERGRFDVVLFSCVGQNKEIGGNEGANRLFSPYRAGSTKFLPVIRPVGD